MCELQNFSQKYDEFSTKWIKNNLINPTSFDFKTPNKAPNTLSETEWIVEFAMTLLFDLCSSVHTMHDNHEYGHKSTHEYEKCTQFGTWNTNEKRIECVRNHIHTIQYTFVEWSRQHNKKFGLTVNAIIAEQRLVIGVVVRQRWRRRRRRIQRRCNTVVSVQYRHVNVNVNTNSRHIFDPPSTQSHTTNGEAEMVVPRGNYEHTIW